MTLLLDTQAVLWVLDDSGRLGRQARAAIGSAGAVHVSAASIWELTVKSMLGKIRVPDGLSDAVADAGMMILPVTGPDAEAVAGFPEIARHDPFDRLLVAQAWRHQLTLLTADRVLLTLGKDFIVDASR